eukprot:Filipodium_phascolosomae@DN2485_c0_g1_i2.p1
MPSDLFYDPQETFLFLTKLGVRKATLRWDMILLQAVMAGFYVGVSGTVSVALAGGINPSYHNSDPAVTKFLLAILFPTGLAAILATGAELFTGNTMTMMCALLERKVRFWDLLKNWGLALLGNAVGCIWTAFFFCWLPGTFDDNTITLLRKITEAKVRINWGLLVVKAIGCNMLVCLAMWEGLAAQDGASKVLLLWPPIVCFVMAGFEHSIANLFFIPAGMMHGANVSTFQFIFMNIIPVIIGNVIGGGILIGGCYWYEFHPRDTEKLGFGGGGSATFRRSSSDKMISGMAHPHTPPIHVDEEREILKSQSSMLAHSQASVTDFLSDQVDFFISPK